MFIELGVTLMFVDTVPKAVVSVLVSLLMIGVLLFPGLAEAHRSGCHRWHSCPSDTGSYRCGDLGYYTYCGSGSSSPIGGSNPATNPGSTSGSASGNSSSSSGTVQPLTRVQRPAIVSDAERLYPGWPFPRQMYGSDHMTNLSSYTHRRFAVALEGSREVVRLVPTRPFINNSYEDARRPLVLYEFPGRSQSHYTRGLDMAGSRRIVGTFVNTTSYTMYNPKAHAYQMTLTPARILSTGDVYPAVIRPGGRGYYDFSVSDINSWDDLAVIVDTWDETSAVENSRQLSVVDVGYRLVFSAATVTAYITGDAKTDSKQASILVFLKDTDGNLLGVKQFTEYLVSSSKQLMVKSIPISEVPAATHSAQVLVFINE